MRSLTYPLRPRFPCRDQPVIRRATFLATVFYAGVSAGRTIILRVAGLPGERAQAQGGER